MLDAETKRRIDTARDILVGKVPDPKSQVEQITIALIYKFMDDMDAQSEELGGERTFFAGDFAWYGWAKLMSPSLGGHETLNLYAEAITRMPENPGVPPLFRDIFRNTFLPYRDPETLREFLKIIDQFSYEDSESLGDAYEYLLSVLDVQGDAGQFRTPRHIIDFIVEIVDPKKDEVIFDPACGTAGFLISAYKHVLAANQDADGESTLTPDENGRLTANIRGYDISPDYVRLSRANMYLHGFVSPDIAEYDTLTSEERWNERADVILANPPFMSPKGGIRPHNRFSVQSKRSEVLFADYMAEHLTPSGRAGFIVPEGIIFQGQKAHTQLRKMLVEHYLVAVVSLPAGVFNPYSGVKTSILILDSALAKRANYVAFFKVENDGFNKGTQRRPIADNDLPQALEDVKEFLSRLRGNETLDGYVPALGLMVPKEHLAADGVYNLSGERYRDTSSGSSKFPMVPLGQVAKFIRGLTFRKSDQLERETENSLPVVTTRAAQETGIVKEALYFIPRSLLKNDDKLLQPSDILISTANSLRLLGRTTHVQSISRPVSFGAFMSVIRPDSCILGTYLTCCLRTKFAAEFFVRNANTTTNISNLNLNTLAEFQIPLPPLDIQGEIVEEIEGYQRVIDGARAVVDNWRPKIEVDPVWPLVTIGEVCVVERGASPRPIREFVTDSSIGVNWVKIGDVEVGSKYITETKERITPEGAALSRRVKPGDLILSNSMSFGRPYILAIEGCIHDGWLILRDLAKSIARDFLYHILGAEMVAEQFSHAATGGVVNNLNSKIVRGVKIPLPPLAAQQAIIAEIEREQAIVDSNRELIERFEKKIEATIGRVWNE